MGAYTYIFEAERHLWDHVEDIELNELFQEARTIDSSILIDEGRKVINFWFKKSIYIPTYTVYHEAPGLDGSPYQARLQFAASGERNIVYAYLCGIINGYNKKP